MSPQDADQLAREIDSQLVALSSRTAAAMRAVRRQYSQRLAAVKPGFAIRLALRLLGQSDCLCRFVAYEIVSHHRPAFESLTPGQLLRLGHGLDSWNSVDGFACYLSGPIWREGRLPDAVVIGWAQSEDRWWRRAALVSTVALGRRGRADDARRTVEICARLVFDRDDMVVKALSWALRELGKKNPEEARRFLANHQRNLAALVIREVENKLTTGPKNPRRRVDIREPNGSPDRRPKLLAQRSTSAPTGAAACRSSVRSLYFMPRYRLLTRAAPTQFQGTRHAVHRAEIGRSRQTRKPQAGPAAVCSIKRNRSRAPCSMPSRGRTPTHAGVCPIQSASAGEFSYCEKAPA
jgi:3-methyladenine DNA glycosylase AlkD